MTTYINQADIGLSDEAAPTSAQTAGGTGNTGVTVEKANTGAVVVDTSWAHRGSFSYRFDTPGASDYARLLLPLSSTVGCVEVYGRWSGYPTVGESRMLQALLASGSVYVQLSTAGKWRLYNAAGTLIHTSTGTLPINTPFRASLGFQNGTTTSNGTIRFQFFTGANIETNTPDETGYTSSATDAGTAAFTGIRVGHTTSQNRPSLNLDDIQWSDSSSAIIGAPVSGTTPVNFWTTSNQVIINASGTTNSPTGQTLTQLSGPTVTISGTAPIWTVTLPTGMSSNAVLQLVSSNGAGSDTDTITISPSGAGTTLIRDFKVWSVAAGAFV